MKYVDFLWLQKDFRCNRKGSQDNLLYKNKLCEIYGYKKNSQRWGFVATPFRYTFQEPYCLNLNTDQEHPVRTALLSDIRNMVKTLGLVDAVLVTGDIAYKGHPDEYKVAAKWLLDVTRLAKCKENAVYTVPGNHDVNRNTAGNRITKGIRKTITEHNEIHKRDKELYDTLHDDKSGLELILPMEEYNKFSAAYECDTRPQDSFWLGELPLAPGWKLKMHGLTTTLFSGPENDFKGGSFWGLINVHLLWMTVS